MLRLLFKLSGLVAKSWALSWCLYRLRGIRLIGPPAEEVWYFAYGANMHDSVFRERRSMSPLEWRAGRVQGYRLRFNIEGRPRGKAAPANLVGDPKAEVWGVLYKVTRRDLLHLELHGRHSMVAVSTVVAGCGGHLRECAPGGDLYRARQEGRWSPFASVHHTTARGCSSAWPPRPAHPLPRARGARAMIGGRRQPAGTALTWKQE